MKVTIETWTYPAGLNNTQMRAYKAVLEDDSGATVKEGPVRDSRDEANEDAQKFREEIRERSRQ